MRHFLTLCMAVALVVSTFAQTRWTPLGGWQLIERLDDVQIVKVFRQVDLIPTFKPRWAPSDPTGDFFPADVTLYSRFATSGQYYGYASDFIVLDDININPQRDPSGVGEFRVSRVEIMVYFPAVGVYMIQGYWVESDGGLPPYPTDAPPHTFLRSNQGPHYLFVPQAGVWRLATNPDPYNEVFTVQTSVTDEANTCPQRYNFYLGLLMDNGAAWVCGPLPGTDCNMDYFIQYEQGGSEGDYAGYMLEGGVPAIFGVKVIGAPTTPVTLIGGTITIEGYTGSYSGRTATIKVKRGTQIDTYTTNLYPNGTYAVSVAGQGPAEVLVELPPGLKKKQSVNLTGTSMTLNFTLTNGDVNGDNIVDDADLLAVLFAFGTTGSNPADLTGDSVVDDADLLIVLFNFGAQGDEL
ncbi:hypothetical protein GBSOP10_105012 [Armatimonadetes bacterium GBS]|jgi:hypothetical protein|nr:hypothetical protein GBSOP10_105012 [Armatimonadetes bacterium GBS]CUU38293.1 hypothetical protein GXSOP10_13746 [Armatimonadetes bacterium GXS]